MTTSASERIRAVIASLLASAAFVLAVAVTKTAFAEPSAKDRETARTLLISGREKHKAGDIPGALRDFYRAHAIMHVPTTGLDLGKAQADSGLLVEARTTWLDAAKIPAKPNESAAFARAREEAKKLAEDVTKRLANVTVTIKGLPPRAKVMISVDGADNSNAARNVPFKVNPGKRVIAATHGDSRDSKEVELAEGATKAIELTLAPSAGGEAATAAGGEVDLDGQGQPTPKPAESGSTDEAPAEPPPTPAPKPAEPEKSSTNPLVYAGLATAGLGIAVGTVTGLMSMSTYSSVEPRCLKGYCPPSTHSDIDNGVMLATVSTVSFIIAGIGGGVAVWGLLNPRKSAKTTAGVTVIPTPIGVVGRF